MKRTKEVQVMAHSSTILNLVLRHLPKSEFERFVQEHRGDHRVRKLSCWQLFVCHIYAQLSGTASLRDLELALGSMPNSLYHLGLDSFSRSTIADANTKRPAIIFEQMFNSLVKRVNSVAPGHGFKFKNPLYSLDSTTVSLCLSLFKWAKFRTRKGALKIHLMIDHRGHLPSAAVITNGKKSDIKTARSLRFEPDSIVVVDRGYIDYCWLHRLTCQDIWWVTRLKKNVNYQIIKRHKVEGNPGVTSDWTIRITGAKADSIPIELRRVRYVDPKTGKAYEFLTNIFHLSAKEIADIYKARWDIELFFKWIKQNLKVKSFFGTSENAVRIQIWSALCVYLMLAYLKFISNSRFSLTNLLIRIRTNIMVKIRLAMVLYKKPHQTHPINIEHQLILAFGG